MAAEANGMNLIKSDIANQTFANIYLMGGSEKYLLYQFRDNLVNALIDKDDTMNFVVYKGEDAKADSIIEFASTMPFFAERRVVLVENSGFFKNGCEEMEEFLPEIPETTCLIFVEDTIDKRCKIYKTISKLGKLAMFETPDEKTLLAWLNGLFAQAGIKAEYQALERLVEAVGQDMCMLSNEVKKLTAYCMDKGTVESADVSLLSVSQIEGKIFDMMDALSRKDKERTLSLYSDLLALREPAMRILYLIARQFNLLVRAKIALEENKSQSEIAAFLKVPPFTVKKYMTQSNAYTRTQLLSCINWCQEADMDIKTGRKRDSVAVELLIIKLLHA